jgi:ABC-type transport system substrate-binding protein
LWVQQWLDQLGFDTEVILMDFTSLVNRVFTPTPAGTLDFDIYILGWRLPSPAMPMYHESFFGSSNDTLLNNGNNAPGFSDGRLDAFLVEYNRVTDENDAFDILWEMEQIVFDEKPYIVLYDVPVAEAYRADTVEYPFTTTLAGIQYANGMPALVRPVR